VGQKLLLDLHGIDEVYRWQTPLLHASRQAPEARWLLIEDVQAPTEHAAGESLLQQQSPAFP
jgi:hypothetical protein